MIKLYNKGVYVINGNNIIQDDIESNNKIKNIIGNNINDKNEYIKNTITYNILKNHNINDNMDKLKIKFDKMASHDITYVGIIQTARASGLEKFPIPYILTNCHNSLCAVGGTINEDDHLFGLSCAKKYGGIYVPTHQAVIHQYMREMMAGVGKMILGSDSHTRYGALGTIAIGEGGPELVKQLLNKTYDIDRPEVIGVYLTNKPIPGVGPQDVALAIIGAVFENGYVKNKIMEFIGDGIENLTVDFRNGIDVMTTETTCLSSVWKTDDKVKEWYTIHGRPDEYKKQDIGQCTYYDGLIYVDLSKIKPMIAMPFHPSNVYTIEELNSNIEEILYECEKKGNEQLNNNQIKFKLKDKIKDKRLFVEQGVIAGCAGGTYENICDTRDILKGHSIGSDEFSLSIYPSSQPVFVNLVENGVISDIMISGATVRSAFCGPCFGAGDVPANNCLSIRHTTRNFPNREGAKITNNQIASVALMDARSVAATAINKGKLTAATELNIKYTKPKYYFNNDIYKNRCYNGFGKSNNNIELKFGPNITDWPNMLELTDNIILKIISVIKDPVTTTDELIPSGETSSYRSNPLKLAEFTLSRKDPEYVNNAKKIQEIEKSRQEGKNIIDLNEEINEIFQYINKNFKNINIKNTSIGSTIYAIKPGDGSAREQAASCQKVLGGFANIAKEYATKRYRSNLINWGMLPFIFEYETIFENNDYIFIPNIRKLIENKSKEFKSYIVNKNMKEITLKIDELTDDERKIILSGCLINFYKN